MAFRIEHTTEAGVDRHAGADGGLGLGHRGDIAALQIDQRRRQFALEGGDKLAASGAGGVGRAQDKPAAQVIREFMREYVDRHERTRADSTIISNIRQRRESVDDN